MKLTNMIATLALTLTGSFALADEEVNAAEMFHALEQAGIQSEVAMGTVYVGVYDLFCSRENTYSEYSCDMFDQTQPDFRRRITVSGKQAEAILAAFSGAAPFDPYAVFEFGVQSVTCRTSNGPIDIHEGEKFDCEVQMWEAAE